MMKNLRLTFTSLVLALFTSNAFAQTLFLVQEPSNLSGTYDFTDSFTADGWGGDLSVAPVSGEAVWAYDDGTFVETTPPFSTAGDSACCGPVVNTSEVDGKIAFIYRGTCNFSLKAYQAQAAGAIACVIVNNVPGALVNMLGGDSASAVTIPAVFVSDATGAALRDSIQAGGVEIFLGNNTGLFAYNVGSLKQKTGRAKSFATPQSLTGPSGDTVRVGMWAFNYGNQVAEGVTVNAKIERDGNEVYNETSLPASIPANGDSMYIALPEMLASELGYYTMTYTVSADSTDEFLFDNELVSNFWINDAGIYSKSTVDPEEGPQTIGFAQPSQETYAEWEWCNSLQVFDANNSQIVGAQFATSTSDSAVSLEGKSVFIKIYEVTDYIPGTSIALEELTGQEIYDYTDDLQDEFVTHILEDPIVLNDNTRYLTCLFMDENNEDVYIGYDSQVDYNSNFNDTYPNEPICPLNSGGSWAVFGFTNATAAIITLFENPNGIAESIEELNITPYPNPTVENITIPLHGVNGDVVVDVYDLKGGLVLSETVCNLNGSLRMNVADLNSGIHTFNITFEDASSTSFRVVIAK